MDLKKKGVFLFSEGMAAREFAESAQRMERLGYGVVWFPEAIGRDPLVAASFVLSNTKELIAATGILNIYSRDPMSAAMAQQTLCEQSGGRFLLGLGVSHSVLVKMRGHDYSKPLAAMRDYVAGIAQCHKTIGIRSNLLVEGMSEQAVGVGARGALTAAVGEMPIVVAALGPKMTALSGQIAQGSHPANSTPEHTAEARRILGPGPWLAPMQRVCLTRDASVARAVGRRLLGFYLELPNYRNLWTSLGYSADDMDHGGSDRLIDAMLAWGDENALRARVQAHLDAGADHVPIFPVDASNPARVCWRALEALAD